MSRFPEDRFEKTIDEMDVGESGYTVPWAMEVRYDGVAAIRPDYTISKRPGGTVSMRVTRLRRDSYLVDISEVYSSYKWSKATVLNPTHISVAEVIS